MPGVGWSRASRVDYLKELAEYWRDVTTGASRRPAQRVPQFTTEIDGQTIHFLHVESPEPNATPLMLIHGWPGSFVEFVDVIGPLADPPRTADPRCLPRVVPSMPGPAFGPTHEAGWAPAASPRPGPS